MKKIKLIDILNPVKNKRNIDQYQELRYCLGQHMLIGDTSMFHLSPLFCSDTNQEKPMQSSGLTSEEKRKKRINLLESPDVQGYLFITDGENLEQYFNGEQNQHFQKLYSQFENRLRKFQPCYVHKTLKEAIANTGEVASKLTGANENSFWLLRLTNAGTKTPYDLMKEGHFNEAILDAVQLSEVRHAINDHTQPPIIHPTNLKKSSSPTTR